jgi:hypothetical protein
MGFQLSSLAACCWLALAVGAPAVHAQDRGTLSIRRQGREVGLESFVWSARVSGLDSIILTASYPATKAVVEIQAMIDRHHDGQATFQAERREEGSSILYYAVLDRGRITTRRVERGGERASEHPAAGLVVLLADSTFATYAQIVSLAAEGGRPLVGFFPVTGQRVAFTAERILPARGGSGGVVVRLRGDLTGEIEVQADGRLARVSFPSQSMEAVRKEN